MSKFFSTSYNSFQKQKQLSDSKNTLDIEEREVLKILERKYQISIPLVKTLYFKVGFTIKKGKVNGLSLFRVPIYKEPEFLTNLSSLEKLNFAHTKLEKVGKSICSLSSLKILNLRGNQINHISKDIANLQNLRDLNLSYNQLAELPFTIGSLYRLRFLNLIHNDIQQLSHIFQFLKRNGLKVLI